MKIIRMMMLGLLMCAVALASGLNSGAMFATCTGSDPCNACKTASIVNTALNMAEHVVFAKTVFGRNVAKMKTVCGRQGLRCKVQASQLLK
jgi:hypothetical protein